MKSYALWKIGMAIGLFSAWIMKANGWTPTRRRKPTGRKPGRPRKAAPMFTNEEMS